MADNTNNTKENPQVKPEMIKIDGLDQLKQELDIGFDTKNDKFFEWKDVHLEISRAELDTLHTELLWMPWDTEKLERIKKIIEEKQVVIANAWKETWILKDKIESFPRTSEWMEKAFELIKDNKEPQKYLIISQILNVFVYKNWFSIKKWDFLENISIVDKDWKEQKEYSEVTNKYISKDILKKVFVFESSLKSWNFEGKALEIANKYQINLKNWNKAEIRTQILSNNDIKQEEQMILLSYIDNDYKEVELVANAYFTENNQNLNNNKKELEKATWIEFTKEKTADYARNPDKLVWDVVKEISKNPLLLFSTIWLILWKIFWFKVWKDGGFLMNLLAVWASVWAYKALWAGKYIGDLIEWTNWAREPYKAWIEYSKEVVDWAWTKAKWVPNKITWSIDELMAKIIEWGNFRNTKFIDAAWNQNEILDSNFMQLYNSKDWFPNKLTGKDWKPVSKEESQELNQKLSGLYTKWIEKHWKEFPKRVEKMNVDQVIDFLIEEPATPTPANKASNALATAAWATATAAALDNWKPAPAPVKSKEEIESEKEALKSLLDNKIAEILNNLNSKAKFGFYAFTNHENKLIQAIQNRISWVKEQIEWMTASNQIQSAIKDINLWCTDINQQINIYATKDTQWQTFILNDRDRLSKPEFDKLSDFAFKTPILGYSILDNKSYINYNWDLLNFSSFNFKQEISKLIADFWFVNEWDRLILNSKIENLIPKETKENKKDLDLYKKYTLQELNFYLSDIKNHKVITRRIESSDIQTMQPKSFDEWKTEFSV
ncbi:MAG: hypothetical protein ACD_49C00079G0015 [uncultured bacterium (gcode 4)]|uniref:Uncharacterized protein n=1 Tax=uncultured bacterium (gcode 4) TaxID=1234023 RepID=K2AVY8_9BACT|nr:MAG: hypothetical protein ACD_49C00079G0015 [uncultured bacterium (gcode 4)]